MELGITTVDDVRLCRKGYCIKGTLILCPYHLVFSFIHQTEGGATGNKEIWICYPIIKKISKGRGSTWIAEKSSNGGNSEELQKMLSAGGPEEDFDHYSASHIRIECGDFTYYSFNFTTDGACSEFFCKLSNLITIPKNKNDISAFYAFEYRPNMLEEELTQDGWNLYDPIAEYRRQGLITDTGRFWRISDVNKDYRFCPSYPNYLVTPCVISDNVLKYACKFRSKQRIPAVVYRHKYGTNGNVIARCAQPLVGLNFQNRSIQDEKLVSEIFSTQERERLEFNLTQDLPGQPQRNLIVDLRPIRNAMAQHAMGAGTENIDNYRNKRVNIASNGDLEEGGSYIQHVDKIFGNIDNIHVIRESLNKLNAVLNNLDKYPPSTASNPEAYPLLQQALVKTQWLHRLSIILQSVDRIIKSIHLNNTNVIIHCSDGWDRTSQVSALLQLCLDPYYRTTKGFMVLIEKEWISFGFKFASRADHGGCIGALVPKNNAHNAQDSNNKASSQAKTDSTESPIHLPQALSGTGKTVTSFIQRAASHIKNTAAAAASASASSFPIDLDSEDGEGKKGMSAYTVYSGSSEKSPVFHQFLECVYQIYRQHPSQFEFNSRFLKRLFYHYYSCQYGSFLCDSECELKELDLPHRTVSAWDYFNSRPSEFTNTNYQEEKLAELPLFFNFVDIKWWYELYGRSDEEMNGLSNSLDRKFVKMKLGKSEFASDKMK